MPKRSRAIAGSLKKVRLSAAVSAAASVATLVTYLAYIREFANFGTETDFVGNFVAEAQRVLNGEPLALTFHPPLYAMFLGASNALIDNWFLSGRVVSVLSATVITYVTFLLFDKTAGRYSAWGSTLAILASSTFLTYSASATSDIFFFAVYWSALYAAVIACSQNSPKGWAVAGVLAGLGILSRSNGIVLLGSCVLPLFTNTPRFSSGTLRAILFLALGILVVITLWALFALITDSPFWTSKTYVNIALTYFSPDSDRISGDSRVIVEQQFSGLIDVLTRDPTLMAKTYARDLWNLGQSVFGKSGVLSFPVNMLALAGVIFLIFLPSSPVLRVVMTITVLHMLLINMKAYEARYYLFLVPIAGAGIGIFAEKSPTLIRELYNRRLFIGALSLCFLLAIVISIDTAISDLTSADKELEEAVQFVRDITPENATIVARKGHVAHFAQRNSVLFPDSASIDELESFFALNASDGPLYLYFGTIEAERRPEIAAQLRSEDLPVWLRLEGASNDRPRWALYRYVPQ